MLAVAGLKLKGLPVTPSLKNSVQTLVRTLNPERDAASRPWSYRSIRIRLAAPLPEAIWRMIFCIWRNWFRSWLTS